MLAREIIDASMGMVADTLDKNLASTLSPTHALEGIDFSTVLYTCDLEGIACSIHTLDISVVDSKLLDILAGLNLEDNERETFSNPVFDEKEFETLSMDERETNDLDTFSAIERELNDCDTFSILDVE